MADEELAVCICGPDSTGESIDCPVHGTDADWGDECGEGKGARTSGLVAFLTARLDEDEAAARAAQLRGPGPWVHESSAEGRLPTGEDLFDAAGLAVAIVRGSYLADHLVRHNPARVLREVTAKRQIIAETFRYEAKIDGEWGDCHSADEIAGGLCSEIAPHRIGILRQLAYVYADHPDYDPS